MKELWSYDHPPIDGEHPRSTRDRRAPEASVPFPLEPRRPGRPPDDQFLCSGRDSPVRCADCYGHLSATVHQRGKTYEDGDIRRHYRALKPRGCGRTVADVRALDAVISSMTLQRLTDPAQVATIKALQEERRTERQSHTDEIARVKEVRSYWDRRLKDGKITTTEHAAQVDDLDAQITAERDALRHLDSALVPDLDDDTIGQIVTGWHTATPAARYRDLRRVWAGFWILVTPGSSTDSEAEVRRRVSRPMPIPGTPRS